MSGGPIIRARRYVSAPAGTYPKPRAWSSRTAVGAPAAVEEPLGSSTGAPLDAPEEYQHGPEPLLMGSGADAAHSGLVVEDLGFEEPVENDDLPLLSGPIDDDEAEDAAPSPSRVSRGLVILVTGLVGVVIGAIAGLALLAFLEPDQWTERFLDPIGLWTSTADPLIRASAIMIVVGCGLIGALLPLRLRR